MATPTFCCGFECGTASAHWTLQANATFNTNASFLRSGLRSLRCNGTASTTAWASSAAAGSFVVCRGYVYFTTLPSVSFSIIVGSSDGRGAWFKAADSKIYAAADAATMGATGVTVTTGQWYRLDVSCNGTNVDVQVDGVACGQLVTTSLTPADIRIGANITVTVDMYVDDVLLSATAADYPLGAGKVLGYVPNADGTHTATTTTIVKGTIATPVGANVAGATDVFNWVNARPLLGGATDNTRLVNQQTAGASLYAEVDFEPTAEAAAPRSVEVVTADRQAATQAGTFLTKLNDNGTENTIIDRTASAGVVTDRFARKHYATMPADSAAWTLARFNALKARFGYSGDATPDQYWRGIMLEAEFATVAADPVNPPPIRTILQAVNRASTF